MLSRRGSTSPTQDVIFEAVEDLTNNGILMLSKNSTKRVILSRPRTAQSYCYEFCGIAGVPFSQLRFELDSRPLAMENYVLSPCIVKVMHVPEGRGQRHNSLQPALQDLLASGLKSDVDIVTADNQIFHCHKCILMCRSSKFRAMFESEMQESATNRVEVPTPSSVFSKLLTWIYTSAVKMPETVEGVCQLLLLADEYFLSDLQVRCEDDLVGKIEPENVVSVMVAAQSLPLVSDAVMKECKELFVKQFHTVKELQPNLEEMIAGVPGLMTELFSHFHKASGKSKRRRVTFNIGEGETRPGDEVSTMNSGYSSAASSYT